MSFTQSGDNNEITVGYGVTLTGSVKGNNNKIIFSGSIHPSTIRLDLHGNNNVVQISTMFSASNLKIAIGNHVPAHKVMLAIGTNFSIEGSGRFLLYNSGNSLTIGKDCMFSNNVTIRCGESPHLIFDNNSGAYLDQSAGVSVGNHVWIGENAYITKGARIAADCIVGACAVVTRKFDAEHTAIAGNPAKVVKENIKWIRNRGLLEPGSVYRESYDAFHAKFAGE